MRKTLVLSFVIVLNIGVFGQEFNSLNAYGSNNKIEWLTSSWGNGYGHKIFSYDPGEKTLLTIASRHNSSTWNNLITFTSNGKIGIGTDNPSGLFEIFGNSSSSTNLILSASHPDKYKWRLKTMDRGEAIDMDFTSSDVNDSEEIVLKLSRSNSGRPEFQLHNNALVANNGKIGIGISNPPQALSVNGAIGFQSWGDKKLYSPIDGDLEWSTHSSASGHGFAVSHEGDKRVYLATTGPSYIVGGNVGIGTKTPNQTLTVNGGVGFFPSWGDKKLYSPIDGDLEWSTHSSASGHGFAVSHEGDKRVYLATTGPSYFVGGNVGIGTTTPSRKLVISEDTWGTTAVSQLFSIKKQYGDGVVFGAYVGEFNTDSYGFTISQRLVGQSAISETFRIANTGNVGIGTTTPTYKLAVKGSIGCSEVQVLDVTGWSDFVFAPNYSLRSLAEVETFINQNQHLPDVPSEKEVKANGYDVSEMNAILLQKIEELTLYTIEQQKRIIKLEDDNSELKNVKVELENIKELINQMNK
jgi:hypothetical protein